MDTNIEAPAPSQEITPDAVPEAISGEAFGESVAADTAEQIPSDPITIEGEILNIDNAIADAEAMNADTIKQLSALRQDLGLPETQEEPPSIQSENEEIARLKQQRERLSEQQDGTDEEMEPSNQQEEEPESNEEQNEEKRKEELELRKKSIEQFEKDVTEQFEQDLRENADSSKALNLEQAVQMMKARLTKTLNESAKEFLSGKTNVPPFPSGVEMNWQTYVRPDSKFDEPNWITELSVTVDDRVIEIASERDMNKEQGTKMLDSYASRQEEPLESEEAPQGVSAEDDTPETAKSTDSELTPA